MLYYVIKAKNMPFETVFSEEIRDWFWEHEDAVWNKDEKAIKEFSRIMKKQIKEEGVFEVCGWFQAYMEDFIHFVAKKNGFRFRKSAHYNAHFDTIIFCITVKPKMPAHSTF